MSDTTELDRLEATFASMSKAELARVDKELMAATGDMRWIPNPGPQTAAYFSKADVMLYGGEPGGGKTELILGLAFNCHRRALVMRRRYTDLSAIIDRMLALNGGRDGFNGSPPPSLKKPNLSIELGAANNPGDEQNFIGRPRDLLGIDEATQFTEMQVRLLMGWVRSENAKQRCRVVLATNPPLTSEGLWVIKMFAPWLDDTFPQPAKPGELRWVVTEDDGDRWVDGPAPVMATVSGKPKLVTPMSRTYIPSSVKDNPFYLRSGYEKTLDALPAPIREILMGGFKAGLRDAPGQIIPTSWIREAQKRWTPHPPAGVPMCAMGVDPSGGGEDPMAIACRHDGWFAPIIEIPGKQIPRDRTGSYTAAMVITHRRDLAIPIVDLGGGYGSGCFEQLRSNNIEVQGYKGAAKSVRRTKDKQLGYFNVRSEALWAFREALDPDQVGGSPIALPDDPVLVADLCAPTLDMTFNGIKAESKEDVCERLGRSTNRGDAVIMAWHGGPKALTHGQAWPRSTPRMNRAPAVVMGRRHGR